MIMITWFLLPLVHVHLGWTLAKTMIVAERKAEKEAKANYQRRRNVPWLLVRQRHSQKNTRKGIPLQQKGPRWRPTKLSLSIANLW
jgi:hypothetical protein